LTPCQDEFFVKTIEGDIETEFDSFVVDEDTSPAETCRPKGLVASPNTSNLVLAYHAIARGLPFDAASNSKPSHDRGESVAERNAQLSAAAQSTLRISGDFSFYTGKLNRA